jgi:hypothetical protein
MGNSWKILIYLCQNTHIYRLDRLWRINYMKRVQIIRNCHVVKFDDFPINWQSPLYLWLKCNRVIVTEQTDFVFTACVTCNIC